MKWNGAGAGCGAAFLGSALQNGVDVERCHAGHQVEVGLDRRCHGDTALEREETALERDVRVEREPLLLELIARVEVVLVQERVLEAGPTLALVAALDEAFAWHGDALQRRRRRERTGCEF